MRVWLPKDPSRRALVVGAVCSLLLHLVLVAALYLAGDFAPPVFSKRGEPLFVDIAPDTPQERAPLGNPARPPGPEPPPPRSRVAEAPTPKAPPAAPRPAPAPPFPPPKAAPASPAAAPPQIAKAPVPVVPEAPPAPAAKAPEPEAAPPRAAEAGRPEGQSPPARQDEAADPRFALSKPSLDTPPSIFRRPGGGGGLQGGGRGGVEGEPIPLDTPDPKYQDYFNQVRERIKAKWIYPREAGERGIGGQLLIEFHIAKDGRLSWVELRRSSGVEILDDYAIRAVQLAQPFPPVPDALAKQVLPISGLFTYQIVGSSFVNQFLR